PVPGPGRYAGELWRTRAWIQRAGPLDLYVGGDSLLTLPGLWLRARRRARTAVVYTMDYVPRRFRSAALNWLYHRIDRIAATRADLAWNVSPQIDAARRDRDGSRRLAPH